MSSTLADRRRFNAWMIAIHWAMAVGILTAFGMGLYMVDIPGITPFKLKLINWHKWLGVTLLALVLLRVVVRWASKAPAYPPHWGRRTVLMAKAGHWALYALMLAVPLLGYFYSLAAGFPVVWFGVIELPVFIERDIPLRDTLKWWHELSAKALVLLVAGHVLMALKHHFGDKDRILGRMIPGLKAD